MSQKEDKLQKIIMSKFPNVSEKEMEIHKSKIIQILDLFPDEKTKMRISETNKYYTQILDILKK